MLMLASAYASILCAYVMLPVISSVNHVVWAPASSVTMVLARSISPLRASLLANVDTGG